MSLSDAERLSEDIRLVTNIRWISDDRDNMEFKARASCFQTDALRRLLGRLAQAIEAQRAETVKQGSVEDESAGPKGYAQNGDAGDK